MLQHKSIVTDSSKDAIVLLDAENGDLIKIIDVKGKGLSGLSIDNGGNIYVCYWYTSEISVWYSDFNQSRILLSGSQLQVHPGNSVYSNVTEDIFISYTDSNVIDRFQVIG